MANLMKMKRSSVPGKVPTTADLELGELAINTYDGKAYMKKNVSGVETVVLLTGAGAGDVLGPASSGDNAIARFDATSGKIIQNSSATVDDSGNLTSLTQQATGTGANKMPVGTTAQRPASPTQGMYRMNSTTGEPEWYDSGSSSWVPFGDRLSYSIDYLVVAGGGGGGGAAGVNSVGGAGGGAGGMVYSSATVVQGSSLIVTVGAGGAGGASGGGGSTASNGSAGSASSLGALATAVGGGGGANGASASKVNGGSGGSGGGGGWESMAGGSGTSGQGYNGGAGNTAGTGGGGGRSANGGTSPSSYLGGVGGNGLAWLDSVTYAGGGGAGSYAGAGASGGTGGGGTGGGTNNSNGLAGTANTGGGGGGAGRISGTGYTGGNGGSGIVIVRYAGPQRAQGGVVTSSGGYTYHTFTSSGTYVA